jgi:hypothetical protein
VSAQPAPPAIIRRTGAGRPIGSRSVRAVMRERLIADLLSKLGGPDRVGMLGLANVESVADMLMAAKQARADLLVGKATINDVVKMENAVGRALQRLNLPSPGSSTASTTLHDIVARHTVEEPD